MSFTAAIQRMGSFVLVVLAHSTQRLFCGGCSRSAGLQMKQLCEFEQFVFAGHGCFPPSFEPPLVFNASRKASFRITRLWNFPVEAVRDLNAGTTLETLDRFRRLFTGVPEGSPYAVPTFSGCHLEQGNE